MMALFVTQNMNVLMCDACSNKFRFFGLFRKGKKIEKLKKKTCEELR